VGRLPEPEVIVNGALASLSNQDLAGLKVTIATGGTREPIDAVRYIGNRSSGKQGIALADAAAARGAQVSLIAINIEADLSRFERVVHVSTTKELSLALNEVVADSDVLLMPAAVSDFKVESAIAGKLSRADSANQEIQMVANPDVLAGLADLKLARGLKTILVGFAAEVIPSGEKSDALQRRAEAKLTRKKVDLIVANDVSDGKVFDADSNDVVIVSTKGATYAKGTKLEVANAVLEAVVHLDG
jgi:phosphopantothenoylcysteine decarboxylase/phosphopantothenate--cysteine ligase